LALTVFNDDDLMALSLLQHLVFCERQCALICNEQLWGDNALTIGGTQMHKRAHGEAPRRERRGDIIVVRGLMMSSRSLGLSGKADVVEFHKVVEGGVHLKGLDGVWCPFPIEYKHGKPKVDDCDRVQLCAQALCLEEMMDTVILEGAIFYGRTQRREAVEFTEPLRTRTQNACFRLHEILAGGENPPAVYTEHCERCSMVSICMPTITESAGKASKYLNKALMEFAKKDDMP
jgi:CRISPR-associated exonuclease Cas4